MCIYTLHDYVVYEPVAFMWCVQFKLEITKPYTVTIQHTITLASVFRAGISPQSRVDLHCSGCSGLLCSFPFDMVSVIKSLACLMFDHIVDKNTLPLNFCLKFPPYFDASFPTP